MVSLVKVVPSTSGMDKGEIKRGRVAQSAATESTRRARRTRVNIQIILCLGFPVHRNKKMCLTCAGEGSAKEGALSLF